jgi:cystathionine gamma-synthase
MMGFQRFALSGYRNVSNGLRSLSSLTSEEAGRRAEEMAKVLSSSSTTTDGSHLSLPTLLAHAGMEYMHNAPMSPPLHLSTTHTRPADGVYLAEDSKYGRMDNATRLLLERTMFDLECVGFETHDFTDRENATPASFAFSSGMMAVTALILAHDGPITVILPDDIYHGVPTLLQNVFLRHNVNSQRVDMTHPSNVASAIDAIPKNNDIIVWIETPSNPLCKVFDIRAICKAITPIKAQRPNITTCVDVTMVSPVITRPLEVNQSQMNCFSSVYILFSN